MSAILGPRTAFAQPADSISELFHENTKLGERSFGRANARIPVEYTIDELEVITR